MRKTFSRWISESLNSSIIEKNRYVWIDYLRGIIIILVVYHHAFLGLAQNGINVPKSVIDANMAAYSFRMPLFFVFSGIFAGLSLMSKPLKTIVWRKFNILLYPYIIWSVIQITLQILFSTYANSDKSYFDYVYILYQPKRLEQFWYLPALFNSTIVFLFLKSRFKIRTGWHLVLSIAFFLLAPFINSISMLSTWMRFYIFLVIGDILAPFIFKKEIQTELRKVWYFLAFIPLFVIAQFYYFNVIGVRSLENASANSQTQLGAYLGSEMGLLVISLVGCTTFILLSFLVEKWGRLKWLRIVGYHSLYIYIMHVIVVAFVRTFFIRVMGIHNYVIILPAAIALGVLIPIVFYNLIGKKYLWFLFSTLRPKQNSKKFRETTAKSPDILLPSLPSPINNI